jgi:NADP-dependent aldehyde dehydrogenase
MCTKPGFVLLPDGPAGDAVEEGIREVVEGFTAQVALNQGIATAYRDRHEAVAASPGFREVGAGVAGAEHEMQAHLLAVDLARADGDSVEESFGPSQVVARYGDLAEAAAALERLEPSLAATLHMEPGEAQDAGLAALVERMRDSAGRLVFNGVPTGVAVTWAQHHGGPWPATNSLHTSVGATAVRRFLRPVAWQDAPEALLPVELREGETSVPRRVDGVLTLARA